MSESESFINEVSEEVRRDQLYGYVRRYGWIALVLVLALVGGAAWNEYKKAQDRAAAQGAGDALLAALAEDDAAGRAAALAQVEASGDAQVVSAMLTAAAQEEAGDVAAAAATLNALASNGEVAPEYRDLAAFKAAILPTEDTVARRDALTALAQPGGTFSLLAQEQLAFLAISDGETAKALDLLRAIDQDAAVTRGLRERVQTLIVALGAPLTPATSSE